MTIWFPFSATIRKEENSYVSICPEADVICRGETVEEAIENLKKEVEKACKNNAQLKHSLTKKYMKSVKIPLATNL